jgi:hypothetical protein
MAHWHRLLGTLLPLVAALSGCTNEREARPKDGVAASACSPPWQEVWTADSTIALCVPAGFDAQGPNGFARTRGDALPEHWIAVSVAHGADQWSSGDRWPLQLASGAGCVADCTTVEALRSYTDTIANVPAYVEVGLVSGGLSGEVRQPAMVLSAEVRPGARLVVNALSPDTLLLDSLRIAAHSIRVGSASAGDRPRAGHPARH